MKTRIYIFLSIVSTILFQIAFADTTRRAPSEDGTFSAGPYYNAATQSYFELVRSEGNTWQQASHEAANRKFKNTAGQLATINRPETHIFIVRNFIFTENTWIGLRFFCEDSRLVWPNDISHATARFSNWSPAAQLTNVLCTNEEYVAAYINSNAFDWNLNVDRGRADQILIEYPTGKK